MIACTEIGLFILLMHGFDTAECLSNPQNVSTPVYKTKDEHSEEYNIKLKGSAGQEIKLTYSGPGHKKKYAHDELNILPTINRTERFLLDNIHHVRCDFELNSLCSWHNVRNHDDFDWVLYQSSTPTDDTGPDTDHTLRNDSGKYIFTESSAPRNLFDFAWIQSPQVDAVGAVHCFRFWYHMFGTSIGTLRVYQAFNDNLPGRLVWSLSGPQGAKWLHGQVPLESNQPYTVLFEGVIGNGYTGDIAVDDVSLSEGYCDTQPAAASRNDLKNTTSATSPAQATNTATLPKSTTTPTPTFPTTTSTLTTTLAPVTSTTISSPPTRKCHVCQGPPEICEQLHAEQECPADKQYCINELTNNWDASRTVIRRCGTYTDCYDEWWLKYSDVDTCAQFNEKLVYTQTFNCLYCCNNEDGCNNDVNPPNTWTPPDN